jgi:hypothetical protein
MRARRVALVATGLLCILSAAAGRADDKKDTPKAEAKGTLTLGDKKYTLASALAYVNPHSFGKENIVILSEKPLDTAKLKQSFKKNGNDDDFFPNVPHIKLTFREDDKGKLTQFAFNGGGGVIIRQGDKNIRGELAIKDGAAKGSAGTVKPDKARDMKLEFDVTFDVKLTKP